MKNFFRLLTLAFLMAFQAFGSSDDELTNFGDVTTPGGSPERPSASPIKKRVSFAVGTKSPAIIAPKVRDHSVETLTSIFSNPQPGTQGFIPTLIGQITRKASPRKALKLMTKFERFGKEAMTSETQGFYKLFYQDLLKRASTHEDEAKKTSGYFLFLKAMKNLRSFEDLDLAIIAVATKISLTSTDFDEKMNASYWFMKHFLVPGRHHDVLMKSARVFYENGRLQQKEFVTKKLADLQPFYTQRLSF